jgi:sulfopyruvate decarboxylase subunit alpha
LVQPISTHWERHIIATGPDLIHAQLQTAGIKLTAGLPDDWLIPLMARVDQDPGMLLVRVAREPEAVGVCAGAFFGGVAACAFMGIAGLLASGHEFALFNDAHQIPLFILASLRGTLEDPRTYQVAQGMHGVAYLDALEIQHMTIDQIDGLSLIPAAYQRSKLVKRPLVCFLTKRVLFHGIEDSRGG